MNLDQHRPCLGKLRIQINSFLGPDFCFLVYILRIISSIGEAERLQVRLVSLQVGGWNPGQVELFFRCHFSTNSFNNMAGNLGLDLKNIFDCHLAIKGFSPKMLVVAHVN